MSKATETKRRKAPFRLEETVDWEGFVSALRAGGYTESALKETLANCGFGGQLDLPVLKRRLLSPSSYDVLVRLFYIGEVVTPAATLRALDNVPLEPLVRVGLLRSEGDSIRAAAKLSPVRDRFVLGDFPSGNDGRKLPADHVLGVGAASVTLANLTSRTPRKSALDVGTGAGIQALLAARHATRVVGTDTSARALNFAAMNARLNAIHNTEFRTGSFFKPVEGETYDLVVSNPPFVISPETRFLFRDGGLGGDAVSEQVVRGAALPLDESGFAFILINWHHHEEADWANRPRNWVSGTGCDAWILRFKTADPLTYAAEWLRPTEADNPGVYVQKLDAWLSYYTSLGIARISAGAIVMRKRSDGSNWLRCDTIPILGTIPECGDQIQRVFDAETFLHELGDETQLLDQRLAVCSDHVLQHKLSIHDGAWTVTHMQLGASRGLPLRGDADVHMMKLVAGCNGRRLLRDLAAEVATDLRRTFEEVAPGCAAAAAGLLRAGILVPPQDE